MRKLLLFVVLSVLLIPTWTQAASTAVNTAVAGSPGGRLTTTTFTASGTYTPSNPLIWVTGCGAGGGGAGGHSADPGGGGGGGGGAMCVSRFPIGVTPGTALTITIGTAGLGGNAGAAGGVVNVNTTIAGLPIGTWTLTGAITAAGVGTVTNGGAGGGMVFDSGGATGTGAGANGVYAVMRIPGGEAVGVSSGSAGGGATGPGAGGLSVWSNGYMGTTNLAGGAANGTKGGGGTGGSSSFGVGGIGGTNAIGNACTVGYGAGGGGGAPTFAGAAGCPGFLRIEE